MVKRVLVGLNLVVVTVLAWAAFVQPATGATIQYINLAAPSFAARDESTHNPDDCGAAAEPSKPGMENMGQFENSGGSYVQFVRIPQGATVTNFRLFLNDFDMDNDAHAYLARKKIVNGLSPKFSGYKVMAEAHSSGAVNDTIRRFGDSTILVPVIDNTQFMYFVELVVCPFVEPFAVQIVYEGAS